MLNGLPRKHIPPGKKVCLLPQIAAAQRQMSAFRCYIGCFWWQVASAPLNPPQLEDGGIWTRQRQTHISAPASLIHDGPAQSAELHPSAQICASNDKEKSFSAGFTFMNPLDLCSRHVPTGDYYTVQSHYCNKTCIVLELIWVIMRP